MIHVSWLEQTEADVPTENVWLAEVEQASLANMRFPLRRASWRLGRWTAKRAIAVYLNAPGEPKALAAIEIRPAASGAPEAFVAGKPAALVLSLSHRASTALCAIAQPGVLLGCDLETIEPRSDLFVADYVRPEEQALIARASQLERSRMVALLWSGKESALKALRTGLRLDTRSVAVDSVDFVRPADLGEGCPTTGTPAQADCPVDGWSPLRARYTEGQVFHGWWRSAGGLVRTILAAPAPAPPMGVAPAGLPIAIPPISSV